MSVTHGKQISTRKRRKAVAQLFYNEEPMWEGCSPEGKEKNAAKNAPGPLEQIILLITLADCICFLPILKQDLAVLRFITEWD